MNVHEVAVRKLVSALRLFVFLLIDSEMPLAVLRDPVLFNDLLLRGGRRLVLAPVVSLVEHCVGGLDQLLRARVAPFASGGYGDDELTRAGAFRVYRDTRELRESLDELGVL